jgi:thioredoxin 1
MIISLDENNFDQETANGVTLVDFYADWCAPCRRMMPKLESVAEQLKGKVTVAKVNVDKARGLAMKFAVRSVPTFALIENGKVVDVSAGSKSEKDLMLFAEGKKRGV